MNVSTALAQGQDAFVRWLANQHPEDLFDPTEGTSIGKCPCPLQAWIRELGFHASITEDYFRDYDSESWVTDGRQECPQWANEAQTWFFVAAREQDIITAKMALNVLPEEWKSILVLQPTS